MSLIDFTCFDCGKSSQIVQQFGRRDECEHCGADIHACYNCKFYDKGSYNECKEISADVVKEKDRANFCDFFQLGSGPDGEKNKKDDLLAAAEALFKK